MSDLFQHVTDPGRAVAALELGIFSQWICTPSLSASLVLLRRDIPMRTLELLLGLVRYVDRLHFDMEQRKCHETAMATYGQTEQKKFVDPEIELRNAEMRELADMSIPINSELRPVFELGRYLGSLRQALDSLTPGQMNEGNIPATFQQALFPEADVIESCAKSTNLGAIDPIIDRLRSLIRCRPSICQIFRTASAQLSHSSTDSPVVVLDSLIRCLRSLTSSIRFERVTGDDSQDARDAWLYDQAKSGINCERLAKALREKKKSSPDAKPWKLLEADGIRDAISRYAQRHDLPRLNLSRGRPVNKPEGNRAPR